MCKAWIGQIRTMEHKLQELIGREQIAKRVSEVAECIRRDLHGENPLFLCVLKGAVMFAADLVRAFGEPCEIGFLRLSSRKGTRSEGRVEARLPIGEKVEGRVVVVVEDIIDSGLTMRYLLEELAKMKPRAVKVATFCTKPAAEVWHVDVDYKCFEVDNRFIVGYGLDYDEKYRNLPAVCTIEE